MLDLPRASWENRVRRLEAVTRKPAVSNELWDPGVGKTSEIKISHPVADIAPGDRFHVAPELAAPVQDSYQVAIARSAYAITLVAGLNAGWLGALLPTIVQSQHLSLDRAGLLASAVSAGCLCALAVSTPVILRLGDQKSTLLAAALTALGFVGLGTMPGLPALIAGAFCYGLGVGLNSIASHIIFPRYYPATVASALSKLNVFYGVGALVGPMIALAAFSAKVQYNWIFIGAGFYCLVVCVYLLGTKRGVKAKRAAALAATTGKATMATTSSPARPGPKEEEGEGPPKLTAQDFKAIITEPILLGLSLINFLYVGIEATLCAWVYTFLQRADCLDGVMASAALSLLWTGLALGRIVSVKVCLKINPKYVTMTSMILLACATFCTAIFHLGPFLALPLVLLIGLGMGPIFPTIIAQSATRFPATGSTTTTLVISSGYFGGILLPWLLGNALVKFGAANFMLLTGIATVLLPLILGLSLFRRSGEPRAAT